MKTLLVFGMALFSLTARADIIFIDFHHSANEVRAAREAAAIRGEKLIVLAAAVPTKQESTNYFKLSGEIYREQDRLDQLEAMAKGLAKMHSGLAGPVKKERDELRIKLKALHAQFDPLDQKIRFHKEDLDRALSQLESDHRTLTSLVISGHSNGNMVWGEEGSINRPELLEVFSKHPKQKESMEAVLLWGCYSGELSAVGWWGNNFPQVGMLAGFAGPAPLAATASSPALLKDVLIKQGNIEKQTDVKSLERIFSGLRDVSATNAALATHRCYVANVAHEGRKTRDLKAANDGDCSSREEKAIEEAQIFAHYYRAETPQYASEPLNPHGGENPLRAFYDLIQSSDYCVGLMGRVQMAIGIKFDISIVLGMIFYKNVLKNYEAFYGVKMGENRMEVLKKISSPDFKNDKNHQAAEKLLHQLSCVPVSWITTDIPVGKPEAPMASCLTY